MRVTWPAGVRYEEAKKYPAEPLPSMEHHEVSGEAAVQHLYFHLEAFSTSRDGADAVLRRWQPRVRDALVAVDRALSAAGGYFVHFFREPDRLDPDVSGMYGISIRFSAFARSPKDFDVDALPEWRRISAFAAHRREPWGELKLGAYASFDAPEGVSHVGVNVAGHPLDFYFDLDQARRGLPDVPGAALTKLLCYLKPRVEKALGVAVSLDSAEKLPFLLDFKRKTDAYGLWLGESQVTPWSRPRPPYTLSGCPRARRRSAELAAMIESMSVHYQPIDPGPIVNLDL